MKPVYKDTVYNDNVGLSRNLIEYITRYLSFRKMSPPWSTYGKVWYGSEIKMKNERSRKQVGWASDKNVHMCMLPISPGLN